MQFFQLIIREVFTTQHRLFKYMEKTGKFWLYPLSDADTPHSEDASREENQWKLSIMEMMGALFGLASYNGVMVDASFPHYFYEKLLNVSKISHRTVGREGKLEESLEALEQLDPEAARGLRSVLSYQGNVEEDLMLTMTVSAGEQKGAVLKADSEGNPVKVTNFNRFEYVSRHLQWVLHDSVEAPFRSFQRGYMHVMGGKILALCTAEELDLLSCGRHELGDFRELEASTRYIGFTATSPAVVWFWSLVHTFSEQKKRKLLCFTTGSDRVPIQGLKDLKFVIQRSGNRNEQIPTAHTCYNILDLPEYDSLEKLREKLDIALEHAEGFGLR